MSLLFRRRHRLSRDRDYRAVFDARRRKHAGPLTVWSRPNGLANPRLGLSIAKRIGNAVARSTLKRRLREAFRHLQHDHADPPLDLVIVAKPHDLLPEPAYRELLDAAWTASRDHWSHRTARATRPDAD